MRKIALTNLCVLTTAIGIASASAADISQRAAMPTKAPTYAPIYSWTGPYIGINGGGGWGSSNFGGAISSGSFNVSGAMFGGTLGYNWQTGPTVLGLEGDIDWTNIRGSSPCGVTSCETSNRWLGTVRGRLGYAMDRFMPYVTGGLAVGDIRTSIAGVGSGSSTKAGWTIGGGLEAALAGPWTAKIEYLYVDLGRGGSIAGSDANFHANVVRAGFNLRF